jgi:L-arabonate dehydrase
MSENDKKVKLRSAEWFGTQDKNGFMYRSWMKNQGIPDHEFEGKPIIGICNTWSELTPCNAHFRKLAEHVKRGILEAGGFPVEFPVFSNGESNLRPTAMLTRNLASMDVEESIRGNPMDGVVLLVGCDKTTPALLMGAAGRHSDHRRHRRPDAERQAERQEHRLRHGRVAAARAGQGRRNLHARLHGGRSGHVALGRHLQHHGHRVDHGLHGRSAGHLAAAQRRHSGRRCAPLRAGAHVRHPHRRDGEEDLKLSKILTRENFENAIRVNAAIGGSTNAVIHLKAIAGRIGVTWNWKTGPASAVARRPSSTCCRRAAS